MSLNKISLGRKVNEIAEQSFIKPNPRLENAVSSAKANGIPLIAVSPLHGQFLAIQCQLIGAKNVLEIGTLFGYASTWLASSGAKVTSIEVNPKHAEVSRENLKGLDVDIRLGAALDILPKLEAEGRKFDFVFIDADWEQQWEYFQWAVKLTRENGCIYVDNVVSEIFETAEAEKGGEIRGENLLTKVGKEKKVTATLMSTVSKHEAGDWFDGFLMAVVKSA